MTDKKIFKVSISVSYIDIIANSPEDAVDIAHHNLHDDTISGDNLICTVEEKEIEKEK